MRGFRCAGCGRALDDVRSCKFRNDRFYCSEFCSEDDEPQKPWPSIWDYPTSPYPLSWPAGVQRRDPAIRLSKNDGCTGAEMKEILKKK